MSKFFLDESKIATYRDEYAKTHCVFLPGFLEKNTLQTLLDKLDRGGFYPKEEGKEDYKFGKILALPNESSPVFIFTMLMSDQNLFNIIQSITDCQPIADFIGRIHRSEAGENHEIGWHNDNKDNRLVAISIGLGNNRYTGGKLQIRELGTKNITREFGQLEAGDAVIFKIDQELDHRLTVLESGRRTVGVGWFRSA